LIVGVHGTYGYDENNFVTCKFIPRGELLMVVEEHRWSYKVLWNFDFVYVPRHDIDEILSE
jgi:hypothetical protein